MASKCPASPGLQPPRQKASPQIMVELHKAAPTIRPSVFALPRVPLRNRQTSHKPSQPSFHTLDFRVLLPSPPPPALAPHTYGCPLPAGKSPGVAAGGGALGAGRRAGFLPATEGREAGGNRRPSAHLPPAAPVTTAFTHQPRP